MVMLAPSIRWDWCGSCVWRYGELRKNWKRMLVRCLIRLFWYLLCWCLQLFLCHYLLSFSLPPALLPSFRIRNGMLMQPFVWFVFTDTFFFYAVSVIRVDSFEDWSVWKLVVTLVFHFAVFHRGSWLNKRNTPVSQHKCNTPVCLCCVPHWWLHSCNTPVSLLVFHRERWLHKCNTPVSHGCVPQRTVFTQV